MRFATDSKKIVSLREKVFSIMSEAGFYKTRGSSSITGSEYCRYRSDESNFEITIRVSDHVETAWRSELETISVYEDSHIETLYKAVLERMEIIKRPRVAKAAISKEAETVAFLEKLIDDHKPGSKKYKKIGKAACATKVAEWQKSLEEIKKEQQK